MRRALGLYVGRGGDGERHPLATVLFWIGCVVPVVLRGITSRLQGAEGATPDQVLLPAWLMGPPLVALLALWPFLGWKPAPRRGYVTALFALAAVLYIFVEGSGTSATLLLVVVANLVITLRPWVGLVAVAAVAATVWATVGLVYRSSWDDALRQAIGVLLVGAATVAVAQVISKEQRGRLDAAGLLEALRKAHGDLQTTHDQLAAAHEQLQQQAEQTRDLAVAQERARLAREVHDAVGHHLTVVKLGLHNAVRLHDRHAEEAAWEEVDEARRSATSALDEVRRAVRAMGPGPLAGSNLGTALGDLVDSFAGAGLATSLVVEGDVRALGPAVDATLYRVTEEALTNVRRHATGATRAEVRLDYCPQGVRLSVTDNGTATGPLVWGFGLAGARARLAELHGNLQVDPADGGGVRVRATIPATAATVTVPAEAHHE